MQSTRFRQLLGAGLISLAVTVGAQDASAQTRAQYRRAPGSRATSNRTNKKVPETTRITGSEASAGSGSANGSSSYDSRSGTGAYTSAWDATWGPSGAPAWTLTGWPGGWPLQAPRLSTDTRPRPRFAPQVPQGPQIGPQQPREEPREEPGGEGGSTGDGSTTGGGSDNTGGGGGGTTGHPPLPPSDLEPAPGSWSEEEADGDAEWEMGSDYAGGSTRALGSAWRSTGDFGQNASSRAEAQVLIWKLRVATWSVEQQSTTGSAATGYILERRVWTRSGFGRLRIKYEDQLSGDKKEFEKRIHPLVSFVVKAKWGLRAHAAAMLEVLNHPTPHARFNGRIGLEGYIKVDLGFEVGFSLLGSKATVFVGGELESIILSNRASLKVELAPRLFNVLLSYLFRGFRIRLYLKIKFEVKVKVFGWEKVVLEVEYKLVLAEVACITLEVPFVQAGDVSHLTAAD